MRNSLLLSSLLVWVACDSGSSGSTGTTGNQAPDGPPGLAGSPGPAVLGGIAWADATGNIIPGLINFDFSDPVDHFRFFDADGNIWGLNLTEDSHPRALPVYGKSFFFESDNCTGSPFIDFARLARARVVFHTVNDNVPRIVRDDARVHDIVAKSVKRDNGQCFLSIGPNGYDDFFSVDDTVVVVAPTITATLPLHPVLVH